MGKLDEINIRLYQDTSGHAPFRAWLNSLKDLQAKSKVNIQITRLRLGNPAKAKSVGEGVLELKIDFGPGYRVYYGQDGEHMVLLLLGGDKSTQSTDITKAKEYWADYKSRKKEAL